LTLVANAEAADVVAVVSSTSAITTLSNAQVTDIFLGKVDRFTGRGQPPKAAAIGYIERSSVDGSVKILVQP
jgi:hypothetical protein